MAFAVENLDVYRKALDFAEQCCRLSEQFGAGYRFLADQLCRASVSVPANLAEGSGRVSDRERTHFAVIARGSATECSPLIEIGRRCGQIHPDAAAELLGRLEEICRMLSGLINRYRGTPTPQRA